MHASNESTPSTPDQVAAVSNLLSGGKLASTGDAPLHDENTEEDLTHEGGGDDDQGDDGSAGEPEAPKKAAIDYKQVIQLHGDRTATLGELKDYYERERPTEIERIDRENKTMHDLAELRTMAAALEAVPQELVARYHQQRQQRDAVEANALLAIKPEWRNPEVFKEAQTLIEKTMLEYGLPTNVNPLDSHQWVKLLHDFASQRASIAKTAAAVKARPNTAPRGNNRPRQTAQATRDQLAAKAKASGNVRDQSAAVAALLNS